MPPLTVGLPVHDDADGLRRSVPSVFSQTWDGPIRLLVVDDGSTDDTPQVLEELQGRYPGLQVIRHPRREGRPQARNRILEEAPDGYLAWIDAGDLWHPRKCELQLRVLEATEHDGPVACTAPVKVAWRGGDVRLVQPQVEGDQVRHALTGRLYPYLWAMLGRAEDFRAVGGFDPRLARRQDYEFLLRFLESGGRVVRTDGPQALATYLKSDQGRDAGEVARANRIIAREHRATYRRYGRRFVRERRAERMLLVARYHAANGAPVAAAVYRGRARAYEPLERVVRTRAAAKLVRTVRRVRAGETLSSTGRSVPPGPRGPVPTARAALRAGDLPRVHDLLAPLLAEGEAPAQAWFLVSEAHRRDGDERRAAEVLELGIDDRPGDPELVLRLAELHAARREWQRAVDTWTPVADAHEHHTPRTYRAVTRALAATGDLSRAVAVAAAGARRWPDDRWIRNEHHRVLAMRTNWEQALSITDPAPPETAPGSVRSLGALQGDEGPIWGEIHSPALPTPEVTLHVGGRPVARTQAVASRPGEPCRFALRCDQIVEYVGDGDLITVEADGVPLSLRGGGPRAVVVTGYASRATELHGLIDAGHVFTKFGKLRPGWTPARKAEVLALYADVADVVEPLVGATLHPAYGNLLGAIRDHDLIAHDVGGFDALYASNASSPEAVKAEFATVCRSLLDAGFDLRLEPWCAMVRRDPESNTFVDVNYGWWDAAGRLQLSFGWRHEPVSDRDAYGAARRCPIDGHLVPVPGDAEALLEQIYGPTWAVPDQGFDLRARLQRDLTFLLTERELQEIAAHRPGRVEVRSVLGPDGEPVTLDAG